MSSPTFIGVAVSAKPDKYGNNPPSQKTAGPVRDNNQFHRR
jgi:hypothetical protein